MFCPNAGKYGPEKTPYLDTFHAVFSKETEEVKVNVATSYKAMLSKPYLPVGLLCFIVCKHLFKH